VRADEIAEVQAGRFSAQLLAGEPARSPVEVAGRLLAIQGQDARGARLAIRARTAGLTAADVDRALTDDRSLLITWLNRGTLHLVRSEDYWWLHRLTAKPQFQIGCLRILARLNVSAHAADTGVGILEQALLADGPLTGAQAAERLVAAGLTADRGAALHTLILANLRGIAVRGPMIGAQQAYVHVRDWLGKPSPEPEPEVALGWLARRYLAGHGPASDRDLARWAGLPLGQVRRGLAVIASELRERPDGLAELASARCDESSLPPPRLLGAFDPVLLGWTSREPILGDYQGIVTVNGLFRAFALVDGRAAGIWTWAGGAVTLDCLGQLPAATRAALAAEASDVQRFLASKPELPSTSRGSRPDEVARSSRPAVRGRPDSR
jgi:Winged helix DNA-binding domain